jgi:hypothetical protein
MEPNWRRLRSGRHGFRPELNRSAMSAAISLVRPLLIAPTTCGNRRPKNLLLWWAARLVGIEAAHPGGFIFFINKVKISNMNSNPHHFHSYFSDQCHWAPVLFIYYFSVEVLVRFEPKPILVYSNPARVSGGLCLDPQTLVWESSYKRHIVLGRLSASLTGQGVTVMSFNIYSWTH